MKNRRSVLFISCYLLMQITVFAQKPDLSAWKIDSLPHNGKLYSYQVSGPRFRFEQTGKQWVVTKAEQENMQFKGDALPVASDYLKTQIPSFGKGTVYTKQVSNGCFVAQNMGEFGGGLYFIDTIKTIAVVHNMQYYINVNGFFELGQSLYFIDGLSHLGSDYGSVSELVLKDGIWQVKFLKYLLEAPIKTIAIPGSVMIFTGQHIYQMTPDKQFKELLKSPFHWGTLCPTSILATEQDIYMAMIAGVLKISNFMQSP